MNGIDRPGSATTAFTTVRVFNTHTTLETIQTSHSNFQRRPVSRIPSPPPSPAKAQSIHSTFGRPFTSFRGLCCLARPVVACRVAHPTTKATVISIFILATSLLSRISTQHFHTISALRRCLSSVFIFFLFFLFWPIHPPLAHLRAALLLPGPFTWLLQRLYVRYKRRKSSDGGRTTSDGRPTVHQTAQHHVSSLGLRVYFIFLLPLLHLPSACRAKKLNQK